MEFAVKKESLRREWQEKTTESQQERCYRRKDGRGGRSPGESLTKQMMQAGLRKGPWAPPPTPAEGESGPRSPGHRAKMAVTKPGVECVGSHGLLINYYEELMLRPY